MKSNDDKRFIWDAPFSIGVALTIIVLTLFIYALIFLPVDTVDSQDTSKWLYLKKATPNEIGDTLSGFAGSLAFIWLVVTVLLQARELREQRKEFHKMSSAMEEQTLVFRLELKREEEQYATSQADELLRHVKSEIEKYWFDKFIIPTNLNASLLIEPKYQLDEADRTKAIDGTLSLSVILIAFHDAILTEMELSPHIDSVFLTNDLQEVFANILSAATFVGSAGPATKLKYARSGLFENEALVKKLTRMQS